MKIAILGGGNMGRQLKYADRRAAPVAVRPMIRLSDDANLARAYPRRMPAPELEVGRS